MEPDGDTNLQRVARRLVNDLRMGGRSSALHAGEVKISLTTCELYLETVAPGQRPFLLMSARWRRTGLRRDECVCDARGKIRRGEPVDGNYAEIWSLWASWR
jgi:hypothetical protein